MQVRNSFDMRPMALSFKFPSLPHLSVATEPDRKMTPGVYSVRPDRSELRVLHRHLWSSDVTHPSCFRASSGAGWRPLEETRQWHGDQGREPDQEERVHISDHR